MLGGTRREGIPGHADFELLPARLGGRPDDADAVLRRRFVPAGPAARGVLGRAGGVDKDLEGDRLELRLLSREARIGQQERQQEDEGEDTGYSIRQP